MKVLDLFAGAGGMALGLEKAGHSVTHSVDLWSPAVETLRANFGHEIIEADLSSQATHENLRNLHPDVVAGGPPCQDFSIAGARNVDGTRANLTWSFAEIVVELQPQYFVMENVSSIEGTPILKKTEDYLSQNGYSMTKTILDASRLGAPQARRRLFLVGALDSPIFDLASYYHDSAAKVPMSVRDYFGSKLDTNFYYAHPRSYKRRAVFSIDEPSSTIRGVNRPMPNSYAFHKADRSTNRSEIRPLTTMERAQIQTFPQSFDFIGSRTQAEQLVGNAVPVNLAKFVGEFLSIHEADKFVDDMRHGGSA
jgi:DNA (cytosine-5)-methyltransferase 1